jgi:hypothetical protein
MILFNSSKDRACKTYPPIDADKVSPFPWKKSVKVYRVSTETATVVSYVGELWGQVSNLWTVCIMGFVGNALFSNVRDS